MSKATWGNRSSFTFDVAITTPKVIVQTSTTNPGNLQLATGDSLSLIGILEEPTSVNLTASVQRDGIAQVVAGGTIVAGNTICSNAVGQAIAFTPTASGTSLRGVIGEALNSCAAGALVDVLIFKSYASNQT
jgi:hypothetical protein